MCLKWNPVGPQSPQKHRKRKFVQNNISSIQSDAHAVSSKTAWRSDFPPSEFVSTDIVLKKYMDRLKGKLQPYICMYFYGELFVTAVCNSSLINA